MDLEGKIGMMVHTMKDFSRMERNTGKEPTDGLMEVYIPVTGNLIILKDLGNITGLMDDNMKEDGETINSTVMEFIHGLMVENMMVNILMIKKKEWAFIFGQMARSMKGNGKMENNMVRVDFGTVKEKVEKVCGKMETE